MVVGKETCLLYRGVPSAQSDDPGGVAGAGFLGSTHTIVDASQSHIDVGEHSTRGMRNVE